jgi:penicillin-binding protein 2
LFIFFAPYDNPRYAGAVVIEHGGGSGAAYPIARDVMTYLFDPAKGLDALKSLEAGWGGTAQQRLERRYAAYAAERGAAVSRPPRSETAIFDRVEAEARVAAQQSQGIANQVIAPRPEANPSSTPAGTASPAAGIEPAPEVPPSPSPTDTGAAATETATGSVPE